MWRKIRLLLIISGLVIAYNANAQFDDPKTIEVGPHVGASYYMGDINPMKPFAMSDLQYGGVVRFNYNNRWTFRFDYTRATVKAEDAVIKWRPERGLSFTTNLNDFSFVAEFNFWEYYTGNPKRNVSPYIFGGISVFQYTPYSRILDDNLMIDTLINLRQYKLDTIYRDTVKGDDGKYHLTTFSQLAEFLGGRTKSIGFSIPFGVGVKFALSKNMAATVEWRMQKTFTDYLDGVGGVYPEECATYEKAFIERNQDGSINFVDSYAMIYNVSDPSATPIETMVDMNGNILYPVLDHENIVYPIVVDNKIVYPLENANGTITNVPYTEVTNEKVKIPEGNYKPGQQRGNSAFNDWFGMIRVSLTWKFNLPDRRGCNLSKF